MSDTGDDARGDTRGDTRYRVADLEVFPSGADLALVHSRDSGQSAFHRAEVVALLQTCRDFRTIDEHLRSYLDAGTAPAPAGPRVAALRRELTRLARAGYLVRAGEPLPAGPEPGAPLTTLAVPTRDRVDRLHRVVEGHARGRPGLDVVVADDSPDPQVRAAARAALGALAAAHGVSVAYAGAEEKARYAAALAEAGIPEEVCRFGLLGAPGPAGTVGANRNTLLLHTVGERLLSVDDDTLAGLAAPPGPIGRPALDSTDDPLQLWYFDDRRAALEAATPGPDDVMALHGRWLGRPPLTALGADPDLDRADPALVRRIRAGGGRIRVTATGAAGDCGWDNADYHLFAEGPTFARLTGPPAGYEARRAGRDLLQSVTRLTVTGRPDPKFAMCVGLDNTTLLPPFPPVGRAEEVVFADILGRCSADSYGALLPRVVRHDPPGERRFDRPAGPVHGMGTWLSVVLGRFDPGPAPDLATALPELGARMAATGRLPAARFDEIVRGAVWTSMGVLASALEQRLADAAAPAAWARDARAFVERTRAQALTPVESWYPAPGGRAGLQQVIVRYGELLRWWPEIVAAAGRLREAGVRPGRPVGAR